MMNGDRMRGRKHPHVKIPAQEGPKKCGHIECECDAPTRSTEKEQWQAEVQAEIEEASGSDA